MEDPQADEVRHQARNRLFGRIMIVGFGLLVLLQVALMLLRMVKHLPA
jgi:hypothetical protein